MEDKFAGNDFHVLGFLSNDFGNQGGDEGQVDACTGKYMVKFDQFAIDHVTQPNAQPVWSWLLAQPSPGPANPLPPSWNFHKYLISREGKLVAHWDSITYPGDDPNNPFDSFDGSEIVKAIQAEIAKPKP